MGPGRVRVVVAWASGQGVAGAKCTHQKFVRVRVVACNGTRKIKAVDPQPAAAGGVCMFLAPYSAAERKSDTARGEEEEEEHEALLSREDEGT